MGLFVQLPGLTADQLSKMFDRIVKDRRKDSPYYVETLVLDPIARFDLSNFQISLYENELDRIKDYFPHFDYLFIGGFPAEELRTPSTRGADIEDSSLRLEHIVASRIVAQLFIDYLRRNNITIPLHWYINWEANLNRFTKSGYKDAWKAYLLPFTNALTQISHINGLNEPEFFWSPYFRKRFGALIQDPFDERSILISGIREVLQSVPRLGWLHFQDGVGRDARKNSDGTIRYSTTAEDAINYYHHVLVPASGGNLRSGLINMEFYVDENVTLHGDPLEHEERQCKYMRANIPVGVSFEIRYWYESVINQMELYSLKNIFIDKGISFPVSISEVAHDLGLTRPISIKDLACHMK